MDALTNAKFLQASAARWGASQGWYYKAINGTPSTGIISAAQTTFSATSALLCMQNTAPTGSNVFTFPDYVRFLVSIVDASGAASAFQYVIAIDDQLWYASGGTQVVTPGTYASNNGPVQALRTGADQMPTYGPQTAIFVGALTLNAATTEVVRTGRGSLKQTAASPVAAVNDEYIFTFSPSSDSSGSAKLGAVATPAIYRQNVGIHSIAPQTSLAMPFWFSGATTGVTVEVDIGWFEMPTS
jgi:hypothetical protein